MCLGEWQAEVHRYGAGGGGLSPHRAENTECGGSFGKLVRKGAILAAGSNVSLATSLVANIPNSSHFPCSQSRTMSYGLQSVHLFLPFIHAGLRVK